MDNNIILAPTTDSKLPNIDSGEKKFKFITLFSRKNIKIIVALILMLFIIILLFNLGDKSSTSASSTTSTSSYISTLEYCERLEKKLEAVISQIDGAGDVKVMVTVEGSPELIYVSDTDTKTSTTTNGTTNTTTSSPIIVGGSGNSSGLIKTEKLPNVKGVIVVSGGAGEIGTKLNILNAIATLLDISTDKITVLKGV